MHHDTTSSIRLWNTPSPSDFTLQMSKLKPPGQICLLDFPGGRTSVSLQSEVETWSRIVSIVMLPGGGVYLV